MMSACAAAADAVPMGALEDALALGHVGVVMAALDGALAVYEAELAGVERTADVRAAAAKAAPGLPGVIAGSMEAGAAAVPLCVLAPSPRQAVTALTRYTRGYPVNRLLRRSPSLDVEGLVRVGADPTYAPKLLRIVKNLDALEAVSVLERPATVYRMVYRGVNELYRLAPGDEFVDLGFVSTTRTKGAISAIADDLGKEEGTYFTMEIRLPKGQHAVDVNEHLGADHKYGHQDELLLPRGTTFVVDSVDSGSGRIVMHAKE